MSAVSACANAAEAITSIKRTAKKRKTGMETQAGINIQSIIIYRRLHSVNPYIKDYCEVD
jgi:hypothetical protein